MLIAGGPTNVTNPSEPRFNARVLGTRAGDVRHPIDHLLATSCAGDRVLRKYPSMGVVCYD
jgi:hypothetical protein